MLNEILTFLAVVCAGLYIWQKWTYNFWQRHQVQHIKALPFIGNIKSILTMKEGLAEQLWTLYKTSGFEESPIIGYHIFHRPTLLIRDVKLIKRVLVSDFSEFSNRFVRTDEKNDPVGHYNLFFMRNAEWRELRTKLTPVFTSGKIKQLYPLMQEVAKELEAFLDDTPNATTLDFKDICARFNADLIATVAFGIETKSIRDADNEFYLQCRSIFELTLQRAFSFFVFLLAPILAGPLHLKLFPSRAQSFLRQSVKHIMAVRESTGTTRHDLIDTLITIKRQALEQPQIESPAKNFDYLVAQAAVFQTAGYESPSSNMAFALYELALQPALQTRLRAEIKAAFKEEGELISYEKLQHMTYLGQVVDESLRKYPTLAYLERQCSTKSEDGVSLQPFSDFSMPCGMALYISIIGIHRDEKHWPNPEHFDPERFAPENRHKLDWDAYLPFGNGPRNCIGMRIGLLQAKLGLVHLLKNHRVVKCEETAKTIRFDPKSFALFNIGGIKLKLEKAN